MFLNNFNFFKKQKPMLFEEKDVTNNKQDLTIYSQTNYRKPRELTKMEQYYLELREKVYDSNIPKYTH